MWGYIAHQCLGFGYIAHSPHNPSAGGLRSSRNNNSAERYVYSWGPFSTQPTSCVVRSPSGFPSTASVTARLGCRVRVGLWSGWVGVGEAESMGRGRRGWGGGYLAGSFHTCSYSICSQFDIRVLQRLLTSTPTHPFSRPRAKI